MPWQNDSAAKRKQDAERYQDPEYKRNRAVVLRRAGGKCEQCGKRGRLQVDHVTPLSTRVDHSLANLQALCSGPGSCHARKSSSEGRAAQRGRARRPKPTPRTQWT